MRGRCELEGEARLRHRERVDVVEHAREEGRELRDARRVARRERDEHLQRRVDLGPRARAGVREQVADELLPVVGLRVPAARATNARRRVGGALRAERTGDRVEWLGGALLEERFISMQSACTPHALRQGAVVARAAHSSKSSAS